MTPKQWLKAHGVKHNGVSCVLYKRVSKCFKTQGGRYAAGTATSWRPGTTVTHPDWRPKESECGSGKFHACDTPWRCDSYRWTYNDRYVAIHIKLVDLYVWPGKHMGWGWLSPAHPDKIAFRKGRVLFECNSKGKRI